MRALVSANRFDADPGIVGEHLCQRGFGLTVVHRESPGDWPTVDGVDLVVALGSDWSVYWDHVQASVDAESELLRVASARGVPVLGICFGGQLLARTLGGHVESAPEAEIGWFAVDSDVPALAGTGPWFQWHADRFTAPPQAEVLASSPRAVQAFRQGRALGLQFHPEVTDAIVERWSRHGGDELVRHGVDAAELQERSRRELGRSAADARLLVEWFLEDVAGR